MVQGTPRPAVEESAAKRVKLSPGERERLKAEKEADRLQKQAAKEAAREEKEAEKQQKQAAQQEKEAEKQQKQVQSSCWQSSVPVGSLANPDTPTCTLGACCLCFHSRLHGWWPHEQAGHKDRDCPSHAAQSDKCPGRISRAVAACSEDSGGRIVDANNCRADKCAFASS